MAEPDERDPYAHPEQRPPARTLEEKPPQKGGLAALLLSVAGAALALPLVPVGLVLSIAGIVRGLRVRKLARREGTHAPGAAAAVIAGGAGVALAASVLVFIAVFWTELRTYQGCQSGANTMIAAQDCEREFRDAIGARVGVTPAPR
ncbi:MAG: hypothetical protein M3467_04335 [Actinomycetota bacterium]|nr:hypothetical protein [Actinomycetota bacterium]